MASNHNNQNDELQCALCSGHFPSRQAFNDHLVRRVVSLTPSIWTQVIHHPLPLPLSPPPPSDDSSDSDSMASLASDSSQSSSTSAMLPPVQSEEAEEENRRNQLTLNLIGEREPLAQIRQREDAIRASGAEESDDPGVDLELSLKTGPAPLDLDLKLGL